MNDTGAKVWCFPDGYLPEKKGGGAMEAHEALMVLNVSDEPANLLLDVYFEDKEPALELPLSVGARRVKTFRLDHPHEIGGLEIPPLTQYALRVRSTVNVVVQFGRLDTTQQNMAYYVGVGYCK